MSNLLHPAFREIHTTSTLDGSAEASLLYVPDTSPAALVVGLHTWSADRFNQQTPMLDFCKTRQWALLLPEFRGPNLTSNPRSREAGGSRLACRDIVDATREVQRQYALENRPVFLHGGSGGGHMGLITAARESFEWTAVSSWCPITDLTAWHGQNKNYSAHIVAVCGGAPSEETKREYCERSPIHYAEILATKNLFLAHGRHDLSVPYSHSWNLAQKIEACQPKQFYFQIFDGTHEILHPVAFDFFDRCVHAKTGAVLSG